MKTTTRLALIIILLLAAACDTPERLPLRWNATDAEYDRWEARERDIIHRVARDAR